MIKDQLRFLVPKLCVWGLALSCVFAVACKGDRPDIERRGAFSGKHYFRFGNYVVLLVEGTDVSYLWRGFNLRHGGATRVPWEQIEFCAGVHRHVATDKDMSNGALVVDGTSLEKIRGDQIVKLVVGATSTVVAEHITDQATRIGDSDTADSASEPKWRKCEP